MPSVKEQLDTIHKNTLHRFTYCTDVEQYGQIEKWCIPQQKGAFVGDCEDYALACRAQCRVAGLKTRLIVCHTELGEGHCVLECDGWIIDNRIKEVTARQDVDYYWICISGYEPGDAWHSLGGNNGN